MIVDVYNLSHKTHVNNNNMLRIIHFSKKLVSINSNPYYVVQFEDSENGLLSKLSIYNNYVLFNDISDINEDLSRIGEIPNYDGEIFEKDNISYVRFSEETREIALNNQKYKLR
jgi:hypothetical protein